MHQAGTGEAAEVDEVESRSEEQAALDAQYTQLEAWATRIETRARRREKARTNPTLRLWLRRDAGGRLMLKEKGHLLPLATRVFDLSEAEREVLGAHKLYFDALAEIEEVRSTRLPITPKSERPQCGARCRDGHPCQARAVWNREQDRPRNGRCRMHGGLSTGPRTEEGKQRIGEARRQKAAGPTGRGGVAIVDGGDRRQGW